jgi:glycosyltransferase involved in cell wall biosynthesis
MPVDSEPFESRPLLTIAIPTYNRSDLLQQLLDCLRKEIRGHPEVRLLVSDNASTDSTERVVEDERTLGTPLDYIRNAENVGADANFLQCFERATGKYVWIMSDDDLLRPGTVATVVSYLERDEYDLVFIEQAGFWVDPAATIPRTSPRKPIVCTQASEFLRRVHIFTTLISCNIINKDRVDSVPHAPFSTLVNSNLIQLGWTFTALRNHRKSLYVADRLVYYRLGNTGGYGVCRVFGTQLARITREWLATPRLDKIVLNASLQRLLPRFVLASKTTHGAYAEEDPHAQLSGEFRHNVRYWLFLYPLLVLPGRLAGGWLQVIRVVNRLDRALGYPFLVG